MYQLNTISRSYAKAAFDFAIENNNILHWIYMLEFTCCVYQNTYIKNMFLSKCMSNEMMFKYIKNICQNDIDKNFENFLKILINNKRLNLIPFILIFFKKLNNKKNKIKEIKIISPIILKEKQIKKIKICLEKKLLCKIKINLKIDKDLILGLKIIFNNKTIDSTVQNKINKLINILKIN